MSIVCKVVETKKDLKAFIDFPHDLYKDDKNYVPEIYIGQRSMFDKKSYPYYKHGDACLFLVYRDKTIVGRIAAIHHPLYNEYHSSNAGFFGFFDCIDDVGVAGILLEKARQYSLKKGYTTLMGPTNHTTNETAGMLIDGFDSPPMIMMTYNFPYYVDLMEKNGLQKEMDLLAYYVTPQKVEKKSLALSDAINARLKTKGIVVRKISVHAIEKDAAMFEEIYNNAWEKNWGFVPFTHEEFVYLKNDLVRIIQPDFVYVAEKNNKPVGFMICIPNMNEILIHNKRGRLLPWGIFRLWFGKSKIKTIRVLAMGVIEGYRKQGIEAVFMSNVIKEALKHNITGAEASWILENNTEMNQSLLNAGANVYKTYRIYSQSLV
ncbi:MAG: GNAT family N-acetyltransferase [Saprospiraceae bacterium]|nr:GNAT family N-acetyltransferase [Saprospiraceae bacterium]